MYKGELTKSIFEDVPELLPVLNFDLCFLVVNRSLYDNFEVQPAETIHHFVSDIGNGHAPLLCNVVTSQIVDILPKQRNDSSRMPISLGKLIRRAQSCALHCAPFQDHC